MVEFVNRVITGLVSVAVIVAVLGSLRRRPFRRDLVWLSLSLVLGVIAQIVLGGITVLTDLNPRRRPGPLHPGDRHPHRRRRAPSSCR